MSSVMGCLSEEVTCRAPVIASLEGHVLWDACPPSYLIC